MVDHRYTRRPDLSMHFAGRQRVSLKMPHDRREPTGGLSCTPLGASSKGARTNAEACSGSVAGEAAAPGRDHPRLAPHPCSAHDGAELGGPSPMDILPRQFSTSRIESFIEQ